MHSIQHLLIYNKCNHMLNIADLNIYLYQNNTFNPQRQGVKYIAFRQVLSLLKSICINHAFLQVWSCRTVICVQGLIPRQRQGVKYIAFRQVLSLLKSICRNHAFLQVWSCRTVICLQGLEMRACNQRPKHLIKCVFLIYIYVEVNDVVHVITCVIYR